MKKSAVTVLSIINSIPAILGTFVSEGVDTDEIGDKAEKLAIKEMEENGIDQSGIDLALEDGFYNDGTWGIFIEWHVVEI